MKKERGSQFPEDFTLTPDREAYARSKGIQDPTTEFEHFTAYHLARGTLFKDWNQAWRTWCLNFAKFTKFKRAVLNDEDEITKKMKAWREKSRQETLAAHKRMG